MNHGPLIFLAAFFALAGSWFGLVLTPQMQVGQLPQTNALITSATYPLARPGLARQGLDVYRANGCASCHSQQVGQSATVCDVQLTGAGTNQAAAISALRKVNSRISDAEAGQIISALPRLFVQGVSKAQADGDIRILKDGGNKAELWIRPVGPDIERGWGNRRSVAEDFLFDSPVMLGSQRIGPDLANIGVRQPDPNWHLRHLYAPRSEVKDSAMPPYRFLFERRRIERVPSPDALNLPADLAPPAGFEIVPKPEAKALVAFLTSLRAEAPLFDAPLTIVAAPDTNAAPATGEPATNSPPAK